MNKIKKYCVLLLIFGTVVLSQLLNINCGSQEAHSETDSVRENDDITMTVYGKVLNPDGNPVANAIVAAVIEKPGLHSFGNSLTGDDRFSVKADSEGNYRITFTSIDRGGRHETFSHLVRRNNNNDGGIILLAHPGNTVTYLPNHIWFSDLANGLSEPVKLTNGIVGPVDIRLTKGGTISGIVYNSKQKPAAGQTVRIAYENGQYNRYFRPVTTTDKNGHFTITNIRPGNILVIASEYYAIFDEKSPFPENHYDINEGFQYHTER